MAAVPNQSGNTGNGGATPSNTIAGNPGAMGGTAVGQSEAGCCPPSPRPLCSGSTGG